MGSIFILQYFLTYCWRTSGLIESGKPGVRVFSLVKHHITSINIYLTILNISIPSEKWVMIVVYQGMFDDEIRQRMYSIVQPLIHNNNQTYAITQPMLVYYCVD